jgi:MoaA/NifB/PqqE/SkfB family radical SAM enzyme
MRPGLIPPPAPPILATVEVTRRCNLSCSFCESRHAQGPEADPARVSSFLQEAAAAGVTGVGFTGGEPLMAEAIDDHLAEAARLGLRTHLNTNGTLVTQERADRLLDKGLTSINVSVDGAEETLHDRFRGAGSFQKTLSGIEALVRSRRTLGVDTRLLAAMTLEEENSHQACDLLDHTGSWGLDGCTYLPCARFLRPGNPADHARAVEGVQALLARAGDPKMDNSRRYLQGMSRYFSGSPMPLRCSALHTSILVSPEGRLYPCVPAALRRMGGVVYEPGRLMDVFRSGALAASVEVGLCRGCWWNCHRELDLALGVI